MPERSLKYIRMTFLLILSCSRGGVVWGGRGGWVGGFWLFGVGFFSHGKLLFKPAFSKVSLLHLFVHLSLDELTSFRVK